MKNLSKRMKILLGVLGAVVVIVVVGLVLGLTGVINMPLQGLSGTYLDPTESCLTLGKTRTFYLRNSSAAVVNWSKGSSAISFTNPLDKFAHGVISVGVVGNTAPVAVWVRTAAAFNRTLATATVYTAGVCPFKATLVPGHTLQLHAIPNSPGYWSSSNPAVFTVDQTGLVKAVGAAGQTATISWKYGNSIFTSLLTIGSADSWMNYQ